MEQKHSQLCAHTESMARESYALLTPIKNEISNIKNLIMTVVSQSITPLVWVIVDGNSTDGSYELAKAIAKDYSWIHVVKQLRFPGQDYGENFSQAVNEAYEHCLVICSKEDFSFSFVGKVDATVTLENDYFELLMKEMRKNPKLAIACGVTEAKETTIKLTTNSEMDKLIGSSDIRLYRRGFFEAMGGYPLEFAPDTILLVKALKRGWDTSVVKKARFQDSRPSGTKGGAWNGYKLRGRIMYRLHYHPFLVALNTLYFFINSRQKRLAFALVSGYIESAIRNEGFVQDREIANYFWRERTKEIIIAMKHRLWAI